MFQIFQKEENLWGSANSNQINLLSVIKQENHIYIKFLPKLPKNVYLFYKKACNNESKIIMAKKQNFETKLVPIESFHIKNESLKYQLPKDMNLVFIFIF